MANDRIIVALDTPDPQYAIRIMADLQDRAVWFKVGHALVNTLGLKAAVSLVIDRGFCVMVDQKLKDTPNQVAVFARQTVEAGASIFTLHCDGAAPMMRAARQAIDAVCASSGLTEKPKILGVTLLTSIEYDDLVTLGMCPDFEAENETLAKQVRQARINELVVRRALLAQQCGLDGVVASPWETRIIREACGPDFLIIDTSIRPADFDPDDQGRYETPRFAVKAGANKLVIGRPITAAPRHMGALAAFRLIDMEIEEALLELEGTLRGPKAPTAVASVTP